MTRHLTAPLLSLCASALLPAQATVERQFVAMGTLLQMVIDAPDRPVAARASEAAIRAVEATEVRLSVWRADSDVSRVNAARPDEVVAVGAETVADLRWAFAFCDKTNGAFDPTLGNRFFAIDDATVTRQRTDAALDCDAFGKGIALDRALAAAVTAGATKVWFDFGGQVMLGGPAAMATEVAIADPDDRSRTYRTLVLPAGHSAATTGNGERPGGHLVDPRTGRLATDFGSVTVIARSAALADAAATALFVVGPERGAETAAELGVEAVFAVRHAQQDPEKSETLEQRVARIERENREIRAMLDERDIAAGASLGSDVSIAGYGEYLFTQRSGRTDVADALRTVLYFGYRFDEKWSFTAELELEHGTTSSSSGTTSSSGSVSVEQGYLEYEACPGFSLRTGLVLVPVGLVNDKHEPTLFLPAQRAQTEKRIIPTTWRELGVEGEATAGALTVRAFVGTGLDGEEFGAAGLRSGRQKGNRAAADDIATALRVDYECCPGFTFGGSAYYQKAGQDGSRNGATAIPELDTVIAEGHFDWRPDRWTVRGLWASAFSDDAAAFATATGRNLARRSDGYYLEVGCDVAAWLCPESNAQVIPFVRHEHIDTQANMPGGFVADPMQDNRILTFGLHVQPRENIVFKLDFEEWDNSFDRLNIGMGYVF